METGQKKQEIGFVKAIKGFLVELSGLPELGVGDLIESERGAKAYVSALKPTHVEAFLLNSATVSIGEVFNPSGKYLSMPVGDFLLGKVVSPLGEVLSGPAIPADILGKAQLRKLDSVALGIEQRKFIDSQLVTGVTTIDLLFPVGKGQRELIVGDARSGKTAFIVNALINQKDSNVICVYGVVGKPVSHFKTVLDILLTTGSLAHTVVVTSLSTDQAPLSNLVPKAAMTVAEYFRDQGKDVLVVIDDMGAQAKIYREMSLYSDRAPGREAYPGDIFYQQASLLERAGSFSESSGSGTITALPVLEISLDDFTGFIPTNLMGMTDGHLLFRASLNAAGVRPAVDVSLSVSRVGPQTQSQIQQALAIRVKRVMAQAEELSTLAGFGGELPLATQTILRQRDLLVELLRQTRVLFIPLNLQVCLLCLPFTKFFADKEAAFVAEVKESLIEWFNKDAELIKLTESAFEFKSEQEMIAKLDAMTEKFTQKFSNMLPKAKGDVVDVETWMPNI